MSYFDINEVRALIKEGKLFSNSLSNKTIETYTDVLSSKVTASRLALGIIGIGTEYSKNPMGVGNTMANKQETNVQEAGTPATPNGQIAWNFFFREHGFTSEGTAGIIGNLMQESGIDPKMHQHRGGPGRGIMQWTLTERWAELLKWAEQSRKNPLELRTQLEYAVIEMKKSKSQQRPVYEYFKSFTDVTRATQFFMDAMERPNKLYAHFDRRLAYAKDALRNYYKPKAGFKD